MSDDKPDIHDLLKYGPAYNLLFEITGGVNCPTFYEYVAHRKKRIKTEKVFASSEGKIMNEKTNDNSVELKDLLEAAAQILTAWEPDTTEIDTQRECAELYFVDAKRMMKEVFVQIEKLTGIVAAWNAIDSSPSEESDATAMANLEKAVTKFKSYIDGDEL